MKSILRFGIVLVTPFFSCGESNLGFNPKWTMEDKNLLLEGLENSFDSLINVTSINPESLFKKPDSNSWSVAEIVEHLVLQDQAYYRELTALASRPEEASFPEDLRNNDAKFVEYASDPNTSQSAWYAVPTGNYKDFYVILERFTKVRRETIKFIKETNADLRRHYTYRNVPDGLLDDEFYRVRKVRDLHQLILNEIAHTYRHIGQISRVNEQLDRE